MFLSCCYFSGMIGSHAIETECMVIDNCFCVDDFLCVFIDSTRTVRYDLYSLFLQRIYQRRVPHICARHPIPMSSIISSKS